MGVFTKFVKLIEVKHKGEAYSEHPPTVSLLLLDCSNFKLTKNSDGVTETSILLSPPREPINGTIFSPIGLLPESVLLPTL